MSDKKMIIRNCPCFFEENEEVNDYTCSWNDTEELACQDCTNCLLKRIVEKCKRTLSINKGSENEFTLGKITFAEFILKDIDIQEVE